MKNAIQKGVTIGLSQGFTVSEFTYTGKLSGQALEVLQNIDLYFGSNSLVDQGILLALEELGLIKKYKRMFFWTHYKLTKEGKQFLKKD